MKRKIIISIVVIVLIVFAVIKLMGNKKAAEDKIYIHDSNAAVLVETNSPEQHLFENSFNYLGTFEAFRQNIISSDAQGKVLKITFEEGDHVSQGSLLAKIDDELLRLQYKNAEIALEGYQNDDKRFSTLNNENAIAGVQVEKNKLGLRSAEIQKQQLEKQLKNTNITAPFSGVVTKKLIDLGSFLGYGSAVAEITDISSLKLTINVPERDVLKFKKGQKVSVKIDIYNDKSYEGVVSNISVQADRAHNFKVQIKVQNNKNEIMSGMYGSALLENSKKIEALAVPRKALIGSSKNPQVYVVENGVAKLKSFSAGTSDGDYIEVISGLTANDKVVVKGQINIQENTKVKTTK